MAFTKCCFSIPPVRKYNPFITGRIRDLACGFANQQRVKVKWLHFVQEDSPDEVGQAIAAWINRFQAALSSAG